MAFEDFQNNNPVIILNEHEDLDDLYSDMTIIDGEPAAPDTFNRSNRDSVSRDVNLEAAITYLARSASLYTTSNAKFLSHCEGDGIDIISYLGPYTGESGIDPSELFTTDSTFIGAAYPQGKVTNMVDKTKVYNRYPCKNHDGWTLATNGWDVEGGNAYVIENAEDSYLKVSTDGITGTLTQGKLVFTSDKLDMTYLKNGVVTVPEKISAGFSLKTGNLLLANTSIQFTVNMYKDRSSSSTVLSGGTFTKTISSVSEFDDVVAINNMALPAEALAASNPAFNIEITLTFRSNSVPITMTLSKLMVHEGEMLFSWTETGREESYLQYGIHGSSTRDHSGFVDLENNDTATVWFWTKFSEFAVTRAQKAVGPVFVDWKGSSECSIGLVHKQDKENMDLYLAINRNGTTEYSTDKIGLGSEYFDKYFLVAYRFRKTTGTTAETTSIMIDACIAIDGKIYSIAKTIKKSELPHVSGVLRPAVLVIGKDICVDSSLTANTDIFISRITEIRYDTEWVNELELYLASLGKKPFIHNLNTDSQILTEAKTATEVIDAAGINLITNPTGKYALIGWTTYNVGNNFVVSHTDPNMGNCFNYTGTASGNVFVYSEPISITPNALYSLRAFIKTRQGDTGKVWIGVRFSNSTIFNPSASYENDGRAICSIHTGSPAFYTVEKISPTTATYAHVYMCVESGSAVSAQWSKIKFEKGEPTFFTEDCGANYAIYY